MKPVSHRERLIAANLPQEKDLFRNMTIQSSPGITVIFTCSKLERQMIPAEHLVICECLDTGYTIETNRDTIVSKKLFGHSGAYIAAAKSPRKMAPRFD
jgi:hypothetical protein